VAALPGLQPSSKLPWFAAACAEMCELCELSELSPDADCIHGETGGFFGLRATYGRASRLSSGARVILPGMDSGRPEVWCFPNCQNFSIKRTPERTLLAAVIRLSAAAPSRGAGMLRTDIIRHFDRHFTVCYTEAIRLASADTVPVVGGNARAERTNARPSRAVVVRQR
jgi:hypothetical protein